MSRAVLEPRWQIAATAKRLSAVEQRPKTVLIVAAFLFAATAIAAAVGALLLFPNTLSDRLWELNKPGAAAFRAWGRISGIPLLLLGAGTFAAAVGLLHRRKW